MSQGTSIKPSLKGFSIRDLLVSALLNAVIPFFLYIFSKKYISSSEVLALAVAAIFPIFDSVVGIVRHRVFDLIALITLLGIGVSLGALCIGGDPKLLLIRESFLTGALGIICFLSLLFPRPLMFYFGRQMMAGQDPEKLEWFNTRWQYPRARFVNRLITIVWGFAFTSEFILRVFMVYHLPSAEVLLISPLTLWGITIGTIVWTFAYVRYVMEQGKRRSK